MENIIMAIIIRIILGGGMSAIGIYLFIETFNQVPAMYAFTSIFGLFALLMGGFFIVWDGWTRWASKLKNY